MPRESGGDGVSGMGVPERCALRGAPRTIQGYTRAIPLHNRHKAFAFNTNVPTRTGEAGEVWASAAASFACGHSDIGQGSESDAVTGPRLNGQGTPPGQHRRRN